uniref:Endonuclease/exonuclease/phosphatase domain-containing protein n=1 Tax=Latimeria chalumnae TaxID=7897 RepID=H3A4M7_LATCH
EARVDRSGGPLPSDGKSSRALRTLARDVGLLDVWWQVHESKREYTYRSLVHKSYSRLDTLLVTQAIVASTIEANIAPNTLSDHASVVLKFFPSPDLIRSNNWHLNNALLKDLHCLDMIRGEIEAFSINEGSVESTHTICDAFKSTLRGWLISFATAQKKKVCERLELSSLEKAHMVDPKNDDLLTKLLETKSKLQQLINSKTEFALFRARKRFFEWGDKAGKMLACRLHHQEMTSLIQVIKDPTGEKVFSPDEINNTFRDFYSKLYTSEVSPSEKELESFLSGTSLPTIPPGTQEMLAAPIRKEEILNYTMALATARGA